VHGAIPGGGEVPPAAFNVADRKRLPGLNAERPGRRAKNKVLLRSAASRRNSSPSPSLSLRVSALAASTSDPDGGPCKTRSARLRSIDSVPIVS